MVVVVVAVVVVLVQMPGCRGLCASPVPYMIAETVYAELFFFSALFSISFMFFSSF